MVTKHRADLPVLCGCFSLAIYFTFGSVYVSMPRRRPLYILQLLVRIPLFWREGLVFSGPCLGLWAVTWRWRRSSDPELLWTGRKEALAWGVQRLLSAVATSWSWIQRVKMGDVCQREEEKEYPGRSCWERGGEREREKERGYFEAMLYFCLKKKKLSFFKAWQIAKCFYQTSPFFLYPAPFSFEILQT